ncbi:MAG: glycoside hydrolase family 97 catalytic domain-containing protein [Alistipes sp.]|jgi:alpha-N-arabinofuranosidase|nr:glycoside hydrolase family 97 catalytic domain-containing protein [Alistipes sp.]
MNKKNLIPLIAATLFVVPPSVAQRAEINIETNRVAGLIDSKIYGQLFEHIYFSPSNGVWNEMIFERTFEPEHFPGITPRDGYFDGWYADDDAVLHSPTRYEQPIRLTSVEGNDYEITMDVNWRAFKLAGRRWSGGALDMRFAFKNGAGGEPWFFRIFDPQYERAGMISGMPGSNAQELQRAREALSKANLAITRRVDAETETRGQMRTVRSWQPADHYIPREGLDTGGTWHKLRITVKGDRARVWWDDRQVLNAGGLDAEAINDLVLWVNYTEALYRNIKVTTNGGRTTVFEGMPEDVKIPAVAPQWKSFGGGTFEMVKGDAVNMDYSQRITATSLSGITQGPQSIKSGEAYIGSIWAKGDGRGTLSVALKAGDRTVASQTLGRPTGEWQEYSFTLEGEAWAGDADFAIQVEGGSVQVDQVTMSSRTGLELGGFRPDILKMIKDLGPTSMRWPGGGYVAQYNWKWAIGPQKDRQRWPHWMWLDYDQNAFGTDEFIRFCREINTEPVMVVRVGFDRPEEELEGIYQDALDWVAYCNEPATGAWGSKRAANGHPEPYNIKYWEIDNEMWEMGIEKYEAAVRKFSEGMRRIDPTIKIIVCGGFPEDAEFIERSANYFDYMSLHHYEGANGYATGPERLRTQYQRYADMFAASSNPNIKLYISEWNLNSIDWRTGLFAGGFLNMCEQTPVVELGAAALFLRRTDADGWNNAFINFDYKDAFAAPNYQVTRLWHDNFSKYRLDYTGRAAGMNIATTLSEDGRRVIVKIVNPTERERTLTVRGDWANIAGDAQYDYYAPGSLTVENSMENKNAVALMHRAIVPENNAIVLTVEPYSAGVLSIEKSSVNTYSHEGVTVASPDGKLSARIFIEGGKLLYSVDRGGTAILEDSPLGLVSNEGDFTSNLTFVESSAGRVDKTYTQAKIKSSHNEYHANTLNYTFQNVAGRQMTVVFQVSDRDVALRYEFPMWGDRRAAVVESEATGFRFPAQTTAFVSYMMTTMGGFARTSPSYESGYQADVPIAQTTSPTGYVFPGLFKIGDNGWALLSETGVTSLYCGSHLSAIKNGVYTVAYPDPTENNGFGSVGAQVGLPGVTPWRTITVGDDLAPIVETTITSDLVEPLYEPSTDYTYGRGTWSWIVWQDASMNWDDQVTYIDLAAEMGWEYILIDALWDANIGYERMEELVRYARSKGVDVFLWYNSNGTVNDAPQGPRSRMNTSIQRKKEMKWLQKIGVKGLKVDFWGGDKQETMRMYEDVLSDANDHGLMIIVHGSTLPRGWERMYPNFVGSEAVLASEMLIFSQDVRNNEAHYASLHPFIRNSVGVMEFGGVLLNKFLNKGNTGGAERLTTDAFQLATAVLFQNPVQMFAITPDNLTGTSGFVMDFMRKVPTTWDETRYVDGYPGRYAVIARRSGDKWYIGGVNATEDALELELDLPMMAGSRATLIGDEPSRAPVASEVDVVRGRSVKVTLQPRGGFVLSN